MGTHEGLEGRSKVWSLAPGDPAYPALQIPVNPSAYVGHKNQIQDPLALSIAWLGNLHYWIVLLKLDLGFREESSDHRDLAQMQMTGPLWSILRHLPKLGAGMPFDPLGVGYAPGRNAKTDLRFIEHMLAEAGRLERALAGHLPDGFPASAGRDKI